MLSTAPPPPRRADAPAPRSWIDVARALALGLVGLAALTGITVTLWRLFGTADPAGINLQGFPIFDSSSIEGQSFYLGEPGFFWQDPDDGYTALGYMPLMYLMVGLLDHVHLWRGWGPVVSGVAAFGLLVLIASVARRRPAAGDRLVDRALAWAEGLGVSAVLWAGVVAGLTPGYIYFDRPDVLMWLFGMIGLLAVPRAMRGSTKAMVVAVLALTAAFMCKQTAISAAVAASIFLAAAAFWGATRWRTVLVFGGSFAALNATLIGLMAIASGGWSWHFNFAQASQQGCCELSDHYPTYVRLFFQEFLASWFWVIVPATVILVVAAIYDRRAGGLRDRPTPRRLLNGSVDQQTAVLLVLFALLALGGSVWSRHIIGATQNQSYPVMWSLAILAAMAYRATTARGRRPATVIAAAVLGVLVISQIPGPGKLLGYGRPKPDVAAAATFSSVPPEIRAVARDRLVYHPFYPDISVPGSRPAMSPSWVNLQPTLAAGREVRWFVQRLLDRGYDAVYEFEPQIVASPIYSAGGVQEQSYPWKLNRVMRLRYRPIPGEAFAREPIPGPDPAPWLERCFGPYAIDGVEWKAHVGGGFWCPTADGVTLRETPAGFSSLRTQDAVPALGGEVRATLPNGGAAELFVTVPRQDVQWGVRARADGGELAVTVTDTGRRVDVGEPLRVPGDAVTWRLEQGDGDAPAIRLDGDVVVVDVPELPAGARLEVGATRGSDARFDLSALRLG